LQYCQQEKGLIISARVLMTNHLYEIVGSTGENVSGEFVIIRILGKPSGRMIGFTE
jgi:hypothetical protein